MGSAKLKIKTKTGFLSVSKFAILRTKKLKTNAQLSTASGHNSRKENAPNADPNRDCHLVFGRDDALESFNKVVEDYDIRIRSNAVRAIEYMVTFSPDQQKHINIKEWTKKNIDFFKEKHGANAILSAHLHMDETTPHLHFIVAPLVTKNEKTKLNCREFLGGKAKMQKLQTDYANSMKGFGLERGNKGSKAHHKKIATMYSQINRDFSKMKKKVDQEMSKIDEPGVFNFKSIYAKMSKQIKSLIKKVATQTLKIQDLTQRNRALEREMGQLRKWVKTSDPYQLTQKHKIEIAQKDSQLADISQSRDLYKKTLKSSQARFEAAEKVIKRDRLDHTLDNSLR